ncbi:MAG: nucleotidyltransferase domain-containing protein [Exilispira sp.]
MRQLKSSGSVKVISLDKNRIIEAFIESCKEAIIIFPQIVDIRLFGSLFDNTYTGLSDIDILIIVNSQIENPIERAKPYFFFFADKFDIPVDCIVIDVHEKNKFENIISKSISYIDLE